jgi:hypothetical protein
MKSIVPKKDITERELKVILVLAYIGLNKELGKVITIENIRRSYHTIHNREGITYNKIRGVINKLIEKGILEKHTITIKNRKITKYRIAENLIIY